MNDDSKGALHHIELWIPNLGRAKDELGWILSRLGYENYQNWSNGISWRWGPTYIVAEESLDLSSRDHQRTAPGLNHLAFNAGSREDVDALAGESAYHGWSQLFADKCTNAGGREHYAAYLMKSGGFELELVATV